MAELNIPCTNCEEKKRSIELGGDNRVIGCTPIPGRPGWCRIEWQELWPIRRDEDGASD